MNLEKIIAPRMKVNYDSPSSAPKLKLNYDSPCLPLK